jgi:hypothetical protein
MPAQWPLPTDHQVGDPGFVEGVDQIAANANDLDTRVAALEGGSGGSGGATTLGGLTDVDTTGATPGEVLKYNGTEWAPDTAGGAGTWGSITGTLSAQTDLQTALAGKKDASWTPGLADLPAGSVVTVYWDGTDWKYAGAAITARPTARTDITVDFIDPLGTATPPAWALTGDLFDQVTA